MFVSSCLVNVHARIHRSMLHTAFIRETSYCRPTWKTKKPVTSKGHADGVFGLKWVSHVIHSCFQGTSKKKGREYKDWRMRKRAPEVFRAWCNNCSQKLTALVLYEIGLVKFSSQVKKGQNKVTAIPQGVFAMHGFWGQWSHFLQWCIHRN